MGKKITHFSSLEIIPHGVSLFSVFLLSSHNLFWCSPPPATFQETLNGIGMQAFTLSSFLCIASSSLMFGQRINYGLPVSRLCWSHREGVGP